MKEMVLAIIEPAVIPYWEEKGWSFATSLVLASLYLFFCFPWIILTLLVARIFEL